MPLYTRKEIRKMCGIGTAVLSVYTKRNKIIMSGDFIDDTIPQNRSQIDKWKIAFLKREALEPQSEIIIEETKEVKPVVEKATKIVKKKTSKVTVEKKGRKKPAYVAPTFPEPKTGPLPPDQNDPNQIRLRKESTARIKLDDDTKQVTYDKKLLEKKISEITLEKIKGELIPYKLVSAVINGLGTGFQNSYKNESSQLLIEIAQKTKMSEEDMAFFKGKLVDIINQSHKNGIAEAKASLKSLIEQNQLKK